MSETAAPKKQLKTVTGVVVSDKMDKTIKVTKVTKERHPLYGKFVRKFYTYKAHDEENKAKTGDTVTIVYGRPISKTKNWSLLEVVAKGEG